MTLPRAANLMASLTSIEEVDMTQTELLTQLRENLVRSFATEELATLCADLGVDYEDLPGQGRAAKARELVAYMDRRGRIAELVRKGSELRPNVAWGAP